MYRSSIAVAAFVGRINETQQRSNGDDCNRPKALVCLAGLLREVERGGQFRKDTDPVTPTKHFSSFSFSTSRAYSAGSAMVPSAVLLKLGRVDGVGGVL
jgi:hypothetical protein